MQDYEVSTTNVRLVPSTETNPDAGTVYEVTCPTCGGKVWVSEYGQGDTCACGIQWVRVEVTAIGLKPDA